MTKITLDEWVDQFSGIRKKSRELWKAIRLEFEEQTPPMTVRQMFYRMSSQGIVPKSESGYGKVQYALTKMRKQGAIPYSWLADNTRWARQPRTYSGLSDMLKQQQEFYRRSLAAAQNTHVEFWLEKDALAGVIYDVTAEYDIPLYVSRGFSSLTYLHAAAESLMQIEKPIRIYTLFDFDASGQKAAQNICSTLREFGAEFQAESLALTVDQVNTMGLQTRTAKKRGTHAKSWPYDWACELDAIPPNTLRGMVRDAIQQHIDQGEMLRLEQIERAERETLDNLYWQFLAS